MKKETVIFDTNFLLLPGQLKFDVFTAVKDFMDQPFELYVVEGTFDELKTLAEGNGKHSQAAKLGLVLSKQKGLKTLDSSKDHVDDAIVDKAQGNIVATQDKELKDRVKENGGKVLTLKNKQKLTLEG